MGLRPTKAYEDALTWRTHFCVPRSHSCERLDLCENVFARVRTRHAWERTPRWDPASSRERRT
jgi:hypothetical protein